MSALATAPEGEDEPGWKDHVTNAIGSLVKSADPEDHDRAGKLMKHLRPEEEEVEESEEGDESEGDDDLDDESQAGRVNPEKKKGKYNSKDDKDGKENMSSRQLEHGRHESLGGNDDGHNAGGARDIEAFDKRCLAGGCRKRRRGRGVGHVAN